MSAAPRDVPAADTSRSRTRAVVAVAATVAGVAATTTMQITGYLATPPAARPEIAYATVHGAVPLVFAVCAVLGVQARQATLPLVLQIAFIWLWIPQTFFAVVADQGAVWPLLRAIDLIWALLLGLLALSYPQGTWTDRVERIAVRVAVVATVLRTVLSIGIPSIPTTCDCAANAYAVVADPAWFPAIDLAYRIVGAALVVFVTIRLSLRWLRASALARSVSFVMPIGLAAWTLALMTDALNSVMRGPVETVRLVAPPATQGPLSIVSLFAVASIPICFAAGTLRLRSTRGRVADLVGITRDGADRTLWRESLARTLGDPGLEVFWWDRGAYRNERGEPAALDVRTASDSLLPIAGGDGAPIAVIRHARELSDDERLLDGVSAALRLTVDNGELRSQVERTLEQVRESRARIVEAGDEARKRLERDLHDGSQQQLVALGMQLRTIVSSARSAGEPALADELEGAISRLTVALRELRELARGIHPTALVEGGLPLALPELAARCPVPVTTSVADMARMPEVVEATAYFVAAESLVNVARHARAETVWLRAWQEDAELRMTVADDGVGGVDGSRSGGTGLGGLIDRVEAIGGRLDVSSPAGRGTTIEVRLPLVPAAPPG